MRAAAIALALASALGCNDTVINGGGGKDLGGFITGDGGGNKDLSLPNGAKFGCNGFVACYNDCFLTSASPSAATCRSTCSAKSIASAPTTFDNALTCGQLWCISQGVEGGTTYKCMVSGSQLVNRDGTAIAETDPGTGNKACGLCLSDALARLFGDTCMNVSSVDCNPTSCTSAINGCLNDLP